ncbi:Intersectin 1 (SH3 domain protein) [Mactra antiquata]
MYIVMVYLRKSHLTQLQIVLNQESYYILVVVYKSKSNEELAAFLFNDFLMLTTSNRPLNNTTHSVFDLNGQVQYKMYKTPVFLNEVMIRKPHTDDAESFTISHIEQIE